MGKFVNPYNFVRSRLNPQSLNEPAYHHRLLNYSGRLYCRLKTLTRLFTTNSDLTKERPNGHKEMKFTTGHQGFPLIPASSLKGVVRSVAETISGSCQVIPDRGCQNIKRLCPSCRIFGMTGKEDPNIFRGKISFTDAEAKIKEDVFDPKIILAPLSTPQPGHKEFYDRRRGRKFYYHQENSNHTWNRNTAHPPGDRFNSTITPVRSGIDFYFTLDYENLTEEELSLLLYSLELEEGLGHKLGMGKPRGLGSVQIRVYRIISFETGERYKTLGAGKKEICSATICPKLEKGVFASEDEIACLDCQEGKASLENFLKRKYRSIESAHPDTRKDLQTILSLDAQTRWRNKGVTDPVIKYPHWDRDPKKNWFNVINQPLPTIEEIEDNPPSKWLDDRGLDPDIGECRNA